MRPTRLITTIVATALIAALGLSACGGGAAAPPTKTETPPATTAAPTAGAAVVTKAAGSPAAAGGVYKIGIHGDKTKAASYYTKTFNEGTDLAVSEVNAAGGINGLKVETTFEDDENNPAVAAQKVQKFAADGAVMIFSSGSSATGRQAQKVAEELKIPIGSPANVVVDLTIPLKRYYFRTGLRDDIATQGLIAYMKAKFPKIAVVRDGTETGLLASDQAIKTLKENGLDPLAVEQINPGATDATAQANKIKASGANAVVLYGADVTLMALYVKAHVNAGNTAPILGSQVLGTPPFDELTKGYNQVVQFIDTMDPARPEVQAIEQKLKAKLGPDFSISYGNVQGYEWTRLVLDAMKRAGAPDREKIRDALEATKNLPTAIGPKGAVITYGPNDHDMYKSADYVLIRRFENGKYGPTVWPEK